MDKTRDVAVIVGILRKESINRKLANAPAELAPTDHGREVTGVSDTH